MAKVSPLQALSERHPAHEEVQGKTGGEVWERAKLFFIPNWFFLDRRISDLFWQLSQSYKLDLLQSELGNREPVR